LHISKEGGCDTGIVRAMSIYPNNNLFVVIYKQMLIKTKQTKWRVSYVMFRFCAACHLCKVLNVSVMPIILSIIILIIVILSVITLSVVIISVVLLSVMAP
jgi:hypothetical protein